ncbi:MAG TPA: NYN domain-containing protein [Ktedonobacteraceae bacterium]|nr:NYN domain-containing protein [Ktedonobacteraceae bacterium]
MTTQPTQPENNDTQVTVVEESSASHSPTNDAAEDAASVQPFTSFIEEFRQREERLGAVTGTIPSPMPDVINRVSTTDNNSSHAEPLEQPPASTTQDEFQAESAAASTTSEERPVSPLLRPPNRIRMPRHGGGRQRETFVNQATAPAAPAAPTTPEEPAAQVNPTPTEQANAINRAPTEGDKEEQAESPRPARRYRFDRPAPATTIISSKSASPGEPAETPPAPASSPESEVTTTVPARAQQDRRRHGQENRQRAKGQPAVASTPIVAVTPVAEEPAPVKQTETSTASEIPVEDLPPLEYADLQAATSRRRRRRRPNGNSTNGNGTTAARSSTQPAAAVAAPSPTAPVSPVGAAPAVTSTRNVATPTSPVTPVTTVAPYTIQSGETVSQMNQGKNVTGPFMGPEPSPARGSVLPIQSRTVRPMRAINEAQRISTSATSAVRSGDGIISTGGINHLANVISQAMQLQSDRMVAELRRANQTPANISVSLPPFPSTERVGVFVDVANLLYSARTLRTAIDFGKLLDFLRGNRRLVRAHAYCPTSPQPGDDQMFLQAVKGLGYRITTKNYKTFASGAKKADMDLDLCMDVVRLVDGKSVDCIVLVSGDSDFMPMLDYCSDHGVRVEVAAFDESMSATLRQSCDLFINLSMLDEIKVP